MVLAPAGAFISNPMGTQDLPTQMKDELKKSLLRNAIVVAGKVSDPELEVSFAGREQVGDVQAAVLDITHQGAEVRWFVDPDTGRLLRASYQSVGPQGPGLRISDYSDFRPVGGLTLPFREDVTFNGEPQQAVVMESIAFNTSPDAALFARPAEAAAQ